MTQHADVLDFLRLGRERAVRERRRIGRLPFGLARRLRRHRGSRIHGLRLRVGRVAFADPRCSHLAVVSRPFVRRFVPVVTERREGSGIRVFTVYAGVNGGPLRRAGRRCRHFLLIIMLTDIVWIGIRVFEPKGTRRDIDLHIRDVVCPGCCRHESLLVLAGPESSSGTVIVIVLSGVVPQVCYLLEVHKSRRFDLVSHLLEVRRQLFKLGAVLVVLAYDLGLEVLVLVDSLVYGRLVFRYVLNKSPFCAPPVAVPAVIRLSQRGVLIG